MNNDKIFLLGRLLAFFLLMTCLLITRSANAQTGTYLKNTLTFTQSGTASLSFTTNYESPGLPTTVYLEIGSDDTSALLASLPVMTFVLLKSTGTSTTLTPGMSSWAAGNDETVTFNYGFYSVSSPSSVPRLLRLDIAYGSGYVAALETWTLNITSFPSGSAPSARLIAFLNDQFGQFTALTPTGQGGNITADVAVTPPSGTSTTVTFTATTTNVPAGATLNWIAEGDAVTSRGTPSGTTLTYNLETCTTGSLSNCCCRNISYRFEVRQGSTVLASNRGVYLQKDLTGCSPPATPSVTLDVSVSRSGNKLIYTATPSTTVTGATYSWIYEGPAGAVTPSASCTNPSSSTCTVTFNNPILCVCQDIIFRAELHQGGTLLAKNRAVYLRHDYWSCCPHICIICPPIWSRPCPKFCFSDDLIAFIPIPYFEFEHIKYPKVPWPWPVPGPGPDPCPQCLPAWKTPVPEGYVRRLIAFKPSDKAGNPLGLGLKDEIKFNVKNAKVIGPLIDNENGDYLLAIEYKEGANPVVSASVTWKGETLSTGEISLEPKAKPVWIVWVLFVLSALTTVYLLWRQYTQRTQSRQSK